MDIPEIPFTFGELISAQADGDAMGAHRPPPPGLALLRLTDRSPGVEQLLKAAAGASIRSLPIIIFWSPRTGALRTRRNAPVRWSG